MDFGFGGNLGILRQFSQTNKKINNNFRALSSGTRITFANDPSRAAISSGLQAQSRSLAQANRNISFSQGALQTASGGLGEIRNNLQRLREIAVQAANGTLGEKDRANLQQEFEQLQSNINDIASDTNFAGSNLLDGSFTKTLQSGVNANQTQQIQIDGVSSQDLGISDEGVATQSSAADALSAIDSALEKINRESASIGAQQNALEFRQNANAIAQENLAAADSQLSGTNLAEAITELSENQVKRDLQLQVLQAKSQSQKQSATALNSVFSKKA